MASKTFIRAGLIEPRIYQQVLAARALDKGNSLIVAPTALGKTIVAVLVADARLGAYPARKILMLSPTKPLAVQHQATFVRLFDIPADQIGLLTGSTPPQKRKEILSNACIVSATPQVIENDLLSGTITLSDFSLVIFDEAHRAVGDYSYVFLASRLNKLNPDCLLLGLTASPGGTSEKIQTVCKNLFIQNVEIKTHADADVVEHVNAVLVEYVFVELPAAFLEIKTHLREFQKEQVLFLKKVGVGRTLHPSMMRRTELLELQSQLRMRISRDAQTNPALYAAVSRLAALLKVAHAETLLETQGLNAVKTYFESMDAQATQNGAPKALRFLLSDAHVTLARAQLSKLGTQGIVHPKQPRLLELVEEALRQKPDASIIVFNHYRDSVRELVEYLNSNSTRIRAIRFVGQASRENDKGLSQKEQVKVIDRLRAGDVNVLVASSVAEEGLDIPSVDLVIFYEPVPSEIRMIQRRGRTGRLHEGRCIVMIAKKTRDEAFYWASVSKEKQMHATLREMKKNPQNAVSEKPMQTTLHSYAASSDDVVIFADHREQASSVVRELVELGAKVHTRALEVGDYVISGEVCFERKTIEDFVSSMLDGRLFNQLVSMTELYKSPVILLEGNPEELFSVRNIHKNAILGALSSIAVNYRVPVLFSRNARETAEFVFVTAKRIQLGKTKDLRIRTGRKGLTVPEMQQFIVESLPLVGPTMARGLLSHFKSVRAVMTASEKELQEVNRMGDKKARKIVKLLNARFVDKKEASTTPAEETVFSDLNETADVDTVSDVDESD